MLFSIFSFKLNLRSDWTKSPYSEVYIRKFMIIFNSPASEQKYNIFLFGYSFTNNLLQYGKVLVSHWSKIQQFYSLFMYPVRDTGSVPFFIHQLKFFQFFWGKCFIGKLVQIRLPPINPGGVPQGRNSMNRL